MAFLDETGLAELWSITKAKAMPTKETAALFGLGEGATVDDALQVVAQMSAADGLTMLTVLDEDGNPIQGVTISGLVNKAGEAVTTDVNGQALVICTAATKTSFVAPYWDIPPHTETVQPLAAALNAVTITMPYIAAGAYKLYTASATKQFRRAAPYDICVVGGGGGGGGLYFKQKNDDYYHEAYACGGGGGAVNSYYGITPDIGVGYPMVIGSGGSAGTASSTNASCKSGGKGGTTSFMEKSAVGGNGAPTTWYSDTSWLTEELYIEGDGILPVTNGTLPEEDAYVYPFGDKAIPAGGGGSKSSNYDGGSPCGGKGGGKFNASNPQSWTTISASSGLAPGGGGGGVCCENYLGDTTCNMNGGQGGKGGVYIRRPAE